MLPSNTAKDRPTPPAVLKVRRRKFLRSLLMASAAVGTALAGLLPVLGRWFSRLRPPGALEEDQFLAACIKCGQCVQVCPVEAIKLAGMEDGVGMGTPWIEPRSQGCDFSCDVMQCVLACPTGALSHDIDFPHQADMGVAVLTRADACLAVQGKGFSGQARGPNFEGTLRYQEIDRWNPIPVSDHPYELESCDLCVRQCPIEISLAGDKAKSEPSLPERSGAPAGLGLAGLATSSLPPAHAIAMREHVNADGRRTLRPEVLEGCVGCGVCEMICPVSPAAIEVRPRVAERRLA